MSLKAYRDWKRQPAVACVFARLMARDPKLHGQRWATISGTDPAKVAKGIESNVARHVSDGEAAAVSLVFTEISQLPTLVAVAQSLATLPEWSVSTTRLDSTPVGPCAAFRIARSIPFGGGTCPSEALVLGPFNEFPATRRAPVAAFELFVGDPLPVDPKTGQPTTKANLAHIMVPMGKSTFDSSWESSRKMRRRSLGLPGDPPREPPEDGDPPLVPDDPRAKAKVSFVVPLAQATAMGIVL